MVCDLKAIDVAFQPSLQCTLLMLLDVTPPSAFQQVSGRNLEGLPAGSVQCYRVLVLKFQKCTNYWGHFLCTLPFLHTVLCYFSLMAISYSTKTPKFVCTYSVAVEFWLLPYKSAAWLMANLKSQAVIIRIFPTMAKYIATDKSQMPHRLIGSYKNGEKQHTEEIQGHTWIG